MLCKEEREYFEILVSMENCTQPNIVNMKRRWGFKNYKDLYKARIEDHQLLNFAKDALAEYEPADIRMCLGIKKFSDNPKECSRIYSKYKGFCRSLYSDIRTPKVIQNAKYYLKLIGREYDVC